MVEGGVYRSRSRRGPWRPLWFDSVGFAGLVRWRVRLRLMSGATGFERGEAIWSARGSVGAALWWFSCEVCCVVVGNPRRDESWVVGFCRRNPVASALTSRTRFPGAFRKTRGDIAPFSTPWPLFNLGALPYALQLTLMLF